MRRALDRFLGKLVSRKLMVWLAATSFMFVDAVPLASEDWVAISLAYIMNLSLSSIPIPLLPEFLQASKVVPVPKKGSSIKSPFFEYICISLFIIFSGNVAP